MSIQINDINAIDDNRNFSAAGIATVGSGSSIITINGSTSTVNIGTGITLSGANGSISIAGTIYASSLNIPIEVSSFDPAIGSTTVGLSSNIILNFNQTVGFGTTGFFEIRTGLNTTGGTLVERLGISSSRVTLNNGGRRITVDPTSNFAFSSGFYVTMSAGFVGANGFNFAGINTVGTAQTYFFTSDGPQLGASFEGGFLICKASPLRWVVSPYSAEVSRTWYSRNDANTTAQSVSGCTGWFVPTRSQLQNPGFICTSFWGPSPCYSSAKYWSSTELNAPGACTVNFDYSPQPLQYKDSTFCIRAFRCVTY